MSTHVASEPGEDEEAEPLDAWSLERQKAMASLRTVDWAEPADVAEAHRALSGVFWGALILARGLHGRENTLRQPWLGTATIYGGLLHVPRADSILSRYGNLWEADPDGLSLTGTALWPAHVQWGADQLVETARHLRAGRTVAAVIVTRNQLERWTINAADSHRIEPVAGEAREKFISRVWRAAQPDLPLDMGDAWAQLSEVLHGRDPKNAVTGWSSVSRDLTAPLLSAVPGDVALLHEWIAEVAVSTFSQVRACVYTLSKQAGDLELANLMLSKFNVVEVQNGLDLLEVRRLFVDPVDPFLAFGDWSTKADVRSQLYRSRMEKSGASGQPVDPAPEVANAITERRARTIDGFRRASAIEAEVRGEDFDQGLLLSRLFRYQAIADGADVVANWSQDPQKASLRLSGEALRTASYMWLEDSNLALFAMRTVLEQVCVARTYRTKPQKAAKMAQHGGKAVSPSRWINASGWNRVQVLGRALGEFSHIDFNSRWSGSRRLLEEIQGDETISQVHTARGNALEAVAYFLALEVIDRLTLVDPALAEGFRAEVTLLDEAAHAEMITEVLERGHDMRQHDFGSPDLGT